jgi:type I restriction enzyme, S subunit
MVFERKKIGDILNFKRGYDLPSSDRVTGKVPIISSAGITDFHNEFKKDGEGIVTGRYGTLGQIFYVNGKYWPLNTTLYITDFKGNYPKFIYYFLKTLGLERFNGAAAVPGLDRNVIHKIDVLFPSDFPTQQKIASLLSAYDELIENNHQRIKLLESIAEDIYKEWFVRLRFPGFETAEIVDGLPKGWSREKLENHLTFFRGKSYSSEELRENDGTPMLNLKNINRNGGFRRDGLKYFEGKYSKNNLAYKGDLIIAVTDMTQNRELVGRVARVPNMNINEFIFSMDLIRIEPIKFSKNFLYSFLRYSGIGLKLAEFANGANVLHLTPNLIYFQKGIFPTLELANKYDELVSPFLEEIDALANKNALLQQTRDLLLPRLISGKLEV